MNETILAEVRSIAASLFQVPKNQVTPDSSPETIDNWDSVAHLSLVLALEQKFNLQFGPDEVDQMRNIRQIAALLESKLPAG